MARVTNKSLSLEVDGDEWAGEINNYRLTSADIPNPTFQQVMDGDADFTLAMNVQQDLASGSAFRYLWDHSGETGVVVTLAPYGNAVATATQPHIPLVCTLPRKGGIGGDAGYDGQPYVETFELKVESVGALVVA